ncbi:hypothetical protein SDC9_145853 [bioreactor metagenome]|uniref:Uncharacterized protein n=1 Tax=bioreactor metagenome TaxID=1076179 RepID=A0A645EB09_9ZZZZ
MQVVRKRVIVPPAFRAVVKAPVDLRHHVIHITALAHPQGHIAVLCVVIVVVVALRADAKRGAGPRRFNGGINALHQRVDILPPPRREGLPICVLRIGRRVKAVVGTLRVKVVVKLNAVYLIICTDLAHPVHDQLLHFGDAGVVVQPVAHSDHPTRFGGVGLILRRGVLLRKLRRRGGRPANAVGVYHRFQPHAAAVRLLHHHGQRVIPGVLPLRAGQKVAPRENAAGIQRVAKRAHMGDHGRDAHRLQIVKRSGNTAAKSLFG